MDTDFCLGEKFGTDPSCRCEGPFYFCDFDVNILVTDGIVFVLTFRLCWSSVVSPKFINFEKQLHAFCYKKCGYDTQKLLFKRNKHSSRREVLDRLFEAHRQGFSKLSQQSHSLQLYAFSFANLFICVEMYLFVTGETKEGEPCNTHTCASYGPWGEWQDCSATCGGGTRTRSRNCNNDPTFCAGTNAGDASCVCGGYILDLESDPRKYLIVIGRHKPCYETRLIYGSLQLRI